MWGTRADLDGLANGPAAVRRLVQPDVGAEVDDKFYPGHQRCRARLTPDQQSPRDHHIRLMAERGRIGWQRATRYGRRNLAESAIGRYKHLIGPKLRARTDAGQQAEVALAVQVLNRMIREPKPISIRRR